MRRSNIQMSRFLLILLAGIGYVGLVCADALRFFPTQPETALALSWVRFGFSACVALLFFAVGALAWYATRNRLVARVLFGLCLSMMVSFALQTAAAADDAVPTAVATIASHSGLALLAVLLLLFPHNAFVRYPSGTGKGRGVRVYLGLLVAALLIVLVSTLSSLMLAIFQHTSQPFSALQSAVIPTYDGWYVLHDPPWMESVNAGCDLFLFLGVILTVVVSYRWATSIRERQQLRLFVGGVILAAAPILILTVLPSALRLQPPYIVDGQISASLVSLLPLALGYAVLRYQILLFDASMQRAVIWVISGVSLVVCGYIVITISRLLFSAQPDMQMVSVIILMVMVATAVRTFVTPVTEGLFFGETTQYRQLLAQLPLTDYGLLDLKDVTILLMNLLVRTFETRAIGVFVLDEEVGGYQLLPPITSDQRDEERRLLVERVLTQVYPVRKLPHWFPINLPCLTRLIDTKGPVSLTRACALQASEPSGLARYLVGSSPADDPLLAPILARGKLIGVLAIGERGDHQPFAGSDFEAIHLVLTRCSALLAAARRAQRENHSKAMLTALTRTMSGLRAFPSVSEGAVDCAKMVATTFGAGAQVWLYEPHTNQLHATAPVGRGPRLTDATVLRPRRDDKQNWTLWYHDWNGAPLPTQPEALPPSCITCAPAFPCAWLPLARDGLPGDVLALTYAQPHCFLPEEQRLLEMVVSQCRATLEHARATGELHKRRHLHAQLQRSNQEDEHMQRSAQALRTSLTVMQGYAELLTDSRQSLSPEQRSVFASRVEYASEEVTLRVRMLLDYSHDQIDVESFQLDMVPLAETANRAVALFNAVIKQQGRIVTIDLPPHILVKADELRLQQVLFLILSNTLATSPWRNELNITCTMDEQWVTVRICQQEANLPEEPGSESRHVEQSERQRGRPLQDTFEDVAISRQVIEAMGGKLWVEDAGKHDSGTVFVFALAQVAENGEDGSCTLPC